MIAMPTLRAQETARKLGRSVRRVLVVGGPANLAHGTIATNLAEVGLQVSWHWDDDENRAPVPSGCDLMLVLRDTASNRAAEHARRAAADAADVTVVYTSRKWARMSQDLVRSRIIKPEALAFARTVPDHVDSELEAPVPDKPSPVLSITQVPNAEQKAHEELKRVIALLFEKYGWNSVMVTKDEQGVPNIAADVATVTIRKVNL